MPYGHDYWLQWFLMQLRSQKLSFRCYNKETGEEKNIVIDCQLRILPGGIYELIFPKEHKDVILASLDFGSIPSGNYDINKEFSILGIKIKPIDYLRKFLSITEVKPEEINTKETMAWRRDWVAIIPIGIREDGEIQETQGLLKDWWHEAI